MSSRLYHLIAWLFNPRFDSHSASSDHVHMLHIKLALILNAITATRPHTHRSISAIEKYVTCERVRHKFTSCRLLQRHRDDLLSQAHIALWLPAVMTAVASPNASVGYHSTTMYSTSLYSDAATGMFCTGASWRRRGRPNSPFCQALSSSSIGCWCGIMG